jgi:hypothetical protein
VGQLSGAGGSWSDSASFNDTFAANIGVNTITLTAVDSDGRTASGTFIVDITAGPSGLVITSFNTTAQPGQTVTLTATFIDPDPNPQLTDK